MYNQSLTVSVSEGHCHCDPVVLKSQWLHAELQTQSNLEMREEVVVWKLESAETGILPQRMCHPGGDIRVHKYVFSVLALHWGTSRSVEG